MSFPKIILWMGIVLFVVIGITALFKRPKKEKIPQLQETEVVQEILLKENEITSQEIVEIEKEEEKQEDLPDANRIDQLFLTNLSKLPFVETITYTSRVPWLKGRPAWIADYATYYDTTRHFIARSLNKKADYFTQKVYPGDRFNVLRKDIDLHFHLLIDLSRCKLWFYAFDKEANERYLLKTYVVSIGRKDAKTASGYLTPIGKYTLGEKVAIYKPGTMGFFKEEKIEMIRVFGTRWLPFDKEVEGCSDIAKGYGIHGSPWIEDTKKSSHLVESKEKIGQYDSDGCIRLASEDIEEIFSIVITKPTIVELVKDFYDADLPGIEK